MRYISNWISSGFGSGYASVAPGTFGSAAALIFWWLLYRLGLPMGMVAQVAVIATTLLVGTASVAYSIRFDGTDTDPQWIVIDEWAGLYLALVSLQPSEWGWIALGFLLFRLFDALKWGPIGAAEKLPGALGIMGDDIVAGALTALCIATIRGAWGV